MNNDSLFWILAKNIICFINVALIIGLNFKSMSNKINSNLFDFFMTSI